MPQKVWTVQFKKRNNMTVHQFAIGSVHQFQIDRGKSKL